MIIILPFNYFCPFFYFWYNLSLDSVKKSRIIDQIPKITKMSAPDLSQSWSYKGPLTAEGLPFSGLLCRKTLCSTQPTSLQSQKCLFMSAILFFYYT